MALHAHATNRTLSRGQRNPPTSSSSRRHGGLTGPVLTGRGVHSLRGPHPPQSFDRRRNLQKYEESLGLFESSSLAHAQEVSFFLLDGTMSTLNTGIASPTDLSVPLPTVSGEQELEGSDSAEALWLASYFKVLATNGLDDTRRLWIDGFYQNLEFLAESIHRSIARRGGEINSIVLEEEAAGQLVVMNVIVPFLFGVPAEKSRLTDGIERGGGIIHSEKLSVLVGLDG